MTICYRELRLSVGLVSLRYRNDHSREIADTPWPDPPDSARDRRQHTAAGFLRINARFAAVSDACDTSQKYAA